jgi:hypothetical protein
MSCVPFWISQPVVRPTSSPLALPSCRCWRFGDGRTAPAWRLLSPGRMAITLDNATTNFAIAEFPVGDPYDGRAFRLTKDSGDVYDVFLHRFGQNDTRDCIGFEAHGRCKHVSGLLALMDRGKLDDCPTIAG